MTPVRLFCAPRFRLEKEDVRIVRSYGEAGSSDDPFLKKLPRDWRLTGFGFTETVEDADFVLVPQSVKHITGEWRRYFDAVYTDARRRGKDVIVFFGGDLSYRNHFERDGVIVFKGSEFVQERRANEITFPGFAEDLGAEYPAEPRRQSGKSTVGFCGYAGFPKWTARAKYMLKNCALDVASFVACDPSYRAYKRGIYFRRKAMRMLEADDRVETNFIVRDAFTGKDHGDPARARREYVGNMLDSNFVLATKGDGNYSIRFYEALSLGRIPLLIDTDMVLPLEGVIDYSKCILRVPHTELHRIGEIVADFYSSLSDEQFIAMQKAAREAFRTYLRYDSYFNFALPTLKEKGIEALR